MFSVQPRDEFGRFISKKNATTNKFQVVISADPAVKAETSNRILVTGDDVEQVALWAAELMIRQNITDLVYINVGKRTAETLTLGDPDEHDRLSVVRLEDRGSLGNCFLRFTQREDGTVVRYENPYLD
jgi:hypothetical protein